MKYELKAVRVYDVGEDTAGLRFLVDRLWPRGVKKERLEPFTWAKDVAPSNDLRKWFGHDPAKFDEFKERYMIELDNNPAAGDFRIQVREALEREDVVLMYAAKDPACNHAIVLAQWIRD